MYRKAPRRDIVGELMETRLKLMTRRESDETVAYLAVYM